MPTHRGSNKRINYYEETDRMLRFGDAILNQAKGIALIQGKTGDYRLAGDHRSPNRSMHYPAICRVNPNLPRDVQERWAYALFTAMTGEPAGPSVQAPYGENQDGTPRKLEDL